MADLAQVFQGIGPPAPAGPNVGLEQLGNQATAGVSNSLQNIASNYQESMRGIGEAWAAKGEHQQRSLANLGNSLAMMRLRQQQADDKAYDDQRAEANRLYEQKQAEFRDPTVDKTLFADLMTDTMISNAYDVQASHLEQSIATAAGLDRDSRSGLAQRTHKELYEYLDDYEKKVATEQDQLNQKMAAQQASAASQATGGKATPPTSQPALASRPAGTPAPKPSAAGMMGTSGTPSSYTGRDAVSLARTAYEQASRPGSADTVQRVAEALNTVAGQYSPEVAKSVEERLRIPAFDASNPTSEVPPTLDGLQQYVSAQDPQVGTLLQNFLVAHSQAAPPRNEDVKEKGGGLDAVAGIADGVRRYQQRLVQEFKYLKENDLFLQPEMESQYRNTIDEVSKIVDSYYKGVGQEVIGTKMAQGMKKSGALERLIDESLQGGTLQDLREWRESNQQRMLDSIETLRDLSLRIRAERAGIRSDEDIEHKKAFMGATAPRPSFELGWGPFKTDFGTTARNQKAAQKRLSELEASRAMRDYEDIKKARSPLKRPQTFQEYQQEKKSKAAQKAAEADGSVFKRPVRGID